MKKTIKEWLTKKELQFILKWTYEWPEEESGEYFDIEDDPIRITKKYLINQLEYLRDDEGWINFESEIAGLQRIINRINKGVN